MPNSIQHRFLLATLWLLALSVSCGQETTTGIVSVGEQGTYRLVLNETFELQPRDKSFTAPASGRPIWIVSCEEDKSTPQVAPNRSWLIHYAAWKAGDYDLRNLLAWPSDFSQERVKPMVVSVVDPLPVRHRGNLEGIPVSKLNLPTPPSRQWIWIIGSFWLVGFVGLFWLGWLRRDPHHLRGPSSQSSPQRRQLLETLCAGELSALTPQTRADGETILLALLSKDYAPDRVGIKERLEQIASHEEGGRLLEAFQQWSESAAIRATPIPKALLRYLQHGSTSNPGGTR